VLRSGDADDSNGSVFAALIWLIRFRLCVFTNEDLDSRIRSKDSDDTDR
jgi:hypothetical protein